MRVPVLALIAASLGLLLARAMMNGRTTESSNNRSLSSGDPVSPQPSSSSPITVRPVVRQSDLAPSDPRYEPLELVSQSGGVLQLREVFDREPRDSVFAPVLEQRVDSQVLRVINELELGARVRSRTVECRTLSCVTTIEVAPEEALAVYELVNGIMLGDMQSPEVSDVDGTVTFVNLYRSEVRRSDYYARFVAAALEPPLALAKAAVRGKP